MPAPLTAGEFAGLMERLGPFERYPLLAVGVSGGADSMALALLAAGWAGVRGGRVLALIVDHGLRAASAGEAAQVRGWLAARGVAARILRWTGPKPSTGIQRHAREARHALLAEACRGQGSLHLLLAHHRDDQAETVAMRAERKSGAAGLAGIPAIREIEGLRLLRPLLEVPKDRLVASLAAAGQAWIEDPSNGEERFARGRLRRSADFAPEPWLALGSEMAARRRAEDLADAAFLAAHASVHPLGFVRCERPALAALEPAGRARVLARILTSVGGRSLPPRGEQVARLAQWLAMPGGTGSRTAGGCRVAAAGRRFAACREAGRIAQRGWLEPGGETLWDGRFRIASTATDRRIEVAAAGPAGRAMLAPGTRATLRRQGVPAAAVEALPAVREEGAAAFSPLADAASCPGGVRMCFAPHIPLATPSFRGANVV
ncbi:tRNA lysidine(34) synthetase TilS [Geminicoccaceae bacterium 1502E]|nr:tRNA lysidine(34) synthetase TilS [Geminicoccaceae bacterium 1502E]